MNYGQAQVQGGQNRARTIDEQASMMQKIGGAPEPQSEVDRELGSLAAMLDSLGSCLANLSARLMPVSSEPSKEDSAASPDMACYSHVGQSLATVRRQVTNLQDRVADMTNRLCI